MVEKDIYKIVDKSIKNVKWFDKSRNLTESDIEDLVCDLKEDFESELEIKDFDLFFDNTLFDIIKKYLMKKFRVKE